MNKFKENVEKKDNCFVKLWNYFGLYEKIWFGLVIIASILVAVFLPEDDASGVSGTLITIMLLFVTIFGLLCEVLTSKQSRWSFFIYIFVEIVQIIVFIIQVRYLSAGVSLLFWLPIHIATFVFWKKYLDRQDKRVTKVKALKTWQSVLCIVICVVWTAVMGYLFAPILTGSEFYESDALAKAVAYLDAGLAILSILDGIFLFLRLREAWIIWLIYIPIEAAIYIISGWWVALVLEAGYLSNTIYGFIKWTKYIRKNKTATQ